MHRADAGQGEPVATHGCHDALDLDAIAADDALSGGIGDQHIGLAGIADGGPHRVGRTIDDTGHPFHGVPGRQIPCSAQHLGIARKVARKKA